MVLSPEQSSKFTALLMPETLDVHAERILRASANPGLLETFEVQESIVACLRALEWGRLRVASPKGTGPFLAPLASGEEAPSFGLVGDLREWEVHAWVKHAVLLALRWRVAKAVGDTSGGRVAAEASGGFDQGRVHGGHLAYFDKLDTRTDLGARGVRVVPPGVVREGAHVAKGCIVMPGYVNVGAHVGAGTMVDTWATVGSCAQIGRNVHLAGGVGIGGVLEPAGARPVMVGDDAFVGSRAIVVEGAVVGPRAVLGANVCITASTPIIDVTSASRTEHRGYVPPGAVVAPGTRPKVFPGGEVQLQCAYIISYRSEKTDAKVSLNDVLRETGLSV
jgi:2,3,4,5-tetrahydropyridine-2-carboxylate N-succinyltransferase